MYGEDLFYFIFLNINLPHTLCIIMQSTPLLKERCALHDDVPGHSACMGGDSLLKECEGVL